VKNILKKTGALLLCVFILLAELSGCTFGIMGTIGGKTATVEASATKDEFYSGIVQERVFFHEDRNERITYFFTDVGRAQLETLKNALEDYYYSEQEVETEIQLYTTAKNINLKDYVGKKVKFKGDFFEAHTIYHQRDIVFMVEEIELDGELDDPLYDI